MTASLHKKVQIVMQLKKRFVFKKTCFFAKKINWLQKKKKKKIKYLFKRDYKLTIA